MTAEAPGGDASADAATVSRTVAGEGAAFTYRQAGRGPALVLLHGIGSGARSWTHQLAGLSPQMRVIAWDAPGYGGSTPLAADRPDADAYASALSALLALLGAGSVHVVGHSFGALVALRFACREPGRVTGVTLASPSSGHALLDDAERTRLREARLADLVAHGPAAMAQKRGPRLLGPEATAAQRQAVIETMAQVDPGGYGQATWMLGGADSAADLARLPERMPVQFVYGEADVVTPPASILRLASVRPAAPVHAVAGAGHAVYLERPDWFNERIAQFAIKA